MAINARVPKKIL